VQKLQKKNVFAISAPSYFDCYNVSMKLQRFFVKNKAQVGADLVVADPVLSHQLAKVLRLKIAETVILFDGDGFDYVSTIAALRKDGAVFHIEKSYSSIALPKVELHLYPSLIKKDKLEWVIQKCTEIGVASFHPVIADRSEKLGFDILREEKIVKEAAEQSGWGRVPKIFAPVELDIAIESAESVYILEGGRGQVFERGLFEPLSEAASSAAKKPAHSDAPENKVVSVFVGPEGGWSEKEKEYFSARLIKTMSLGEETLRAETASVAVSALVLL
jgi:16S rRNA (uracil1498-N3)-methyltransferase